MARSSARQSLAHRASRRRFATRWVSLPAGVLLAATLLVSTLPDTRAAGERERIAAATENARATRVAVAEMRKGGNAVDAAVAAALVSGVVAASSSGIGGGAFIHYYDAATKKAIIIDARETAPAALEAEAFEKRPFEDNQRGRAIGVPGEVAGLYELHSRYGKRKWAEVVAPAIDAAKNGFQLSPHLTNVLKSYAAPLSKDPVLARNWFGSGRGRPPNVKAPELAKTLARIANEGPRAFYEGGIAADLVQATRALGGALSLEDLGSYRVKERVPLQTKWEGYDVLTMPPPSAGGLMLLQTLALYSRAELKRLGFNTPAYQHALAEAFRGAIGDRMHFVGDPDFAKVPIARLLSKKHIARRRAAVSLDRTHAIPRFVQREHGTHHLVTSDADGNAVSLTTTVNHAFGAKVAAPLSGVVLNDELDDFTARAWVEALGLDSTPNRPRPGARPVSSMTPTLVLEDGKVVLAAGGSGGMNIATDVSQAVIAHLAFGLGPTEILDAPRIQIPTAAETIRVPVDTSAEHVADLERRGEIVGRINFTSTAVQMIAAEGTRKFAGADPRKGGFGLVE